MTRWLEDKRKGFNAEAYFAAHAEQITGRKAGFLRSGNVCIQIANDAATTGGWLQDLQATTKRHVDYLTFMLCSDRDCAQPYGAITIAVPELCQKFGCPACQRCRPGEPNWQYRAFTKYRIAQGVTMLLPLLD